MDIKIISDIENPLFNRREIEAEIHTDVTPSKDQVLELVSKKTKLPQENIKIRTIMSKFGSKVFIIVANIYKSAEDKNNTERKTKQEIEADKKAAEDAKAQEVASAEQEPIPEQQKPVKEEVKVKEETPKEDVKVGDKKEEPVKEEIKEEFKEQPKEEVKQ